MWFLKVNKVYNKFILQRKICKAKNAKFDNWLIKYIISIIYINS